MLLDLEFNLNSFETKISLLCTLELNIHFILVRFRQFCQKTIKCVDMEELLSYFILHGIKKTILCWRGTTKKKKRREKGKELHPRPTSPLIVLSTGPPSLITGLYPDSSDLSSHILSFILSSSSSTSSTSSTSTFSLSLSLISTSLRGRIRKILLIAAFFRPLGKGWTKKARMVLSLRHPRMKEAIS